MFNMFRWKPAGTPLSSESNTASELATPLLGQDPREEEITTDHAGGANEDGLDDETRSADIEAVDAEESVATEDARGNLSFSSFIHRPLLSVTHLSVGGITLMEGVAICNFLKFALLTTVQLVLTHTIIRWLDWEHDPENTLKAIFVYESNLLWLDAATFFVVGRNLEADTVAWMFTSTTAALLVSWINVFKFLQHSATLYEIHCTWSWKTWVYGLFVLIVCIVMVVLHVRYALSKRRLVAKLVEVAATALAIFGPSLFLSSSNFHLHHWLAGWWLGMHLNYPTEWSRIGMAWCWGIYINGIAVYGRDPMLVCEYIDYYAQDQRCRDPSLWTFNDDHVVDWRNCSASGYHP